MGGGARVARRAAGAAAAAAAEEAIRRGCEEVLRVKREGDTDGAIVLAAKLVEQYPKSASACNLMGFLLEGKAARAQDQIDRLPAQDPGRVRLSDTDDDPARISEDRARCQFFAHREAILAHLASYHEGCAAWYGKAAQLAPRCAYTRANHARMLGMSNQAARAYKEFNCAIRISKPDCPEKNNPWLDSTDLVPDDKKKASAILMAHDEFDRFLYLSDSDVYSTCCNLLENLHNSHGTPGVKAKKLAKDLAESYPFSARANLLGPFLMRSLIDTSSSKVPRLKQYKQLLRELADCVDLFPASIVICLFRAELLFDMGCYLEASLECLRGLNIARPDDPVSQDIPPGSSSGSGRNGRIGTVIIKLTDVLEQSEEKVTDAQEIEKLLQALRFTPEDEAAERLVKGLVEGLDEKHLEDLSLKYKAAEPDLTEQKCASSKEQPKEVLTQMPKCLSNKDNNMDAVKGTSSKEQATREALTEKPMLNVDAGKADGDKGKAVIKIRQSVLYSNKHEQLTKKTEEVVRPLQIVGNRTLSRETVDTYAEYCFLRSFCSAKKDICHLCVFEDQQYYWNAVPKGNMILHCVNIHKGKGPSIKCVLNTCDARFRTEEDREVHHYYCHVLDTDWWKQW